MLTETLITRYPLVSNLLITFLLFLIGTGLGVRLLRGLRLSIPDPLERGGFALALGMGVLAYLPFLCFALGIGKPMVVAGFILLLGVILWREERRVLRGAWRELTTGCKAWRNPEGAWTWLLAVAIFPLLLTTLFLAVCPPTDTDGLHYHLTAPLRYLREGHFLYLPTILHVHWPMGVEMLFGAGLAFDEHYAVQMIQFGFGLSTALMVFALGQRLGSPLAGWLGAGLIFHLCRGEMSWAYIDVGLAQYALAAIYAFYVSGQERRPDSALAWGRLSALMAGMTATAKLPGILIVLVLSLMTLHSLWKSETRTRRWNAILRGTISYFAIGFLVALPWYLRCLALTGDPFYPYLANLLGAKDWSPEASRRLNEFFQAFNTFRSKNLNPRQVFLVRSVFCVACIGAGVVLCSLRATKGVRPLLVFLLSIAFLQSAASGVYGRYFFPIFPLVALLPFWFLGRIGERSAGVRWGGAILLTLLLWGAPRVPNRVREVVKEMRSSLPVALGQESRDTYLRRQLPLYPLLQWADAHLPADATLVLGLPHDAFPSMTRHNALVTLAWTQDALRFTSYEQMISDLKRLKATHLVLWSDGISAQARAKTEPARENRFRWETEFTQLERLGAEQSSPLYSANGYTLYALRL